MAQPPHEVTPVSVVTVDCAAVDFDLSADQQALRDAAATLLDGKAGSDALRARVGTGAIVGTLPGAGCRLGATTAADAPRGYDDGVWSAMAEQGWLAIELPEDEGGLGLGMVELAVLCEEIGRRLVAAPFLPTIVALGALCSVRGAGGRRDQGLARGAERGVRGRVRRCGAGAERPDRLGAARPGAPQRADAPGRLRAVGRPRRRAGR